LFDKSSKQTPPAVTPKSTSGQAKVNHVSVQSGLPAYLLRARLADEIPTKLRLPHPRVYEEANAVLREMEMRNNKMVQVSAIDGQVVENDTVSISASRPGTMTFTRDLECCIAVSENTPQEGGVAVIDVLAVPCCGANLIEKTVTGRPDVCFFELQYCDILIEGHSEPVTALKDKGAQICLIREDFVRG